MTGTLVKAAWAPGSPGSVLRTEAVQMAVDSLEAMGLSVDEDLAVIAFLQAKTLVREAKTVVVTATALGLGGNLSSRTAAVCSSAPNLVTVGVEKLVQQASPALWSEILAVLEQGEPAGRAHE